MHVKLVVSKYIYPRNTNLQNAVRVASSSLEKWLCKSCQRVCNSRLYYIGASARVWHLRLPPKCVLNNNKRCNPLPEPPSILIYSMMQYHPEDMLCVVVIVIETGSTKLILLLLG